MKRHLIVTVAFALIIVTAPNARAAMCFQYTKSGGGISVAQATLPEPNKCIPFALYEVGDKPGTTLLGAGTGSLCRSTQSNSSSSITHMMPACLGQQQLLRVGDLPASAKPRSRSSHAFSHCRGTVTSGKPGEVGKVGNFYYTDDLVISSCDSNDIKFRVPDGEISECRGFGLRLQNSDQLT